MNKYAKNDKITIGDMVAVYDSYRKDKQTGEICTHYLRVEGDELGHLTVTASQMRDVPQAEPFAVGQVIKHEHVEKPVAEVRFPFYKFVWKSSASNTSTQWLHHDTVAPLIVAEAEPKPEKVEEPQAPDIDSALVEEMLTRIETLMKQVNTQSAELEKTRMENERLKRDIEKAKHTPVPVSEFDQLKTERDSLRSQVAELTLIRKERDQLRSQLAMQVQEAPQEAVCDEFAIVRNESPAGMAKRRKQGYTPIHMQFEGGKLNVVYEKQEQAVALPVERHAAITIPVRQPDYASALNNKSIGADELSAIGNAAIMQAGASVYYGKKAE